MTARAGHVIEDVPHPRLTRESDGKRPRWAKVLVFHANVAAPRTPPLKNTREQLDILNAYQELGSYRAAARLCRTTDKTIKRVVQRLEAGGPYQRRPRRLESNTEPVGALIDEKVRATDGLISAKRLLPIVQAAGYRGSARNLRRAVAKAKADWRRRRRLYRPWVPVPGRHLVMDWTPVKGGLQMFCAVLAWSRYRFFRFARDQRQETTLRLLADVRDVPNRAVGLAKCRYNGAMLSKATLRLPSPLLEKLRKRSRDEGRSLNETAVQALERGLGERVSDEAWLALGSVIEEMPTRRYDPQEFRRRWARLGPGAHRLEEDLDWVRGER